MLVRKIFWFLILIAPSLLVSAEIFVRELPDGRVQYSDQAYPGSKQVSVDPGYSYYTVSKVFDGDTLLLQNGLKVRLLGINAPEVEGRHKPAEPGGDAAKTGLTEILAEEKIRLQPDLEKKDKYGRTLAHVFAHDGKHINLELVKRGLATVSIYPPNLAYTDQLLLAQREAETAERGLWRLKAYQTKSFVAIDDTNYRGWHRVIGRVAAVKNGRKYSYLEFSPRFGVAIANQFLPLFPDLNRYVGNEVEVRGWISRKRQHFTMFVRHPSSIIPISE